MRRIVNKRQILIRWALAHEGRIKTSEANDLLEGFYYYNHQRYVQAILHSMMKSGKIKRVKYGLYELCTHTQQLPQNSNQITMF